MRPLESIHNWRAGPLVLMLWACRIVLGQDAVVPPANLHLQVDGQRLVVEAPRFTAIWEGASLVSVKSRSSGVEFCTTLTEAFPLELFYVNNDLLKQDKHQQIQIKQLNGRGARIVIAGNDSTREMLVRLDPETGDLCVKPQGQSARRGLLAIRWNIPFAREDRLLLPCVNGISVESQHEFPYNDRFPWPYRWNAQLVVAEREGQSLMIHSEDNACQFKALNMVRRQGQTTLGFDSEQLGPVWENRAAGGVEWRLNVYDGDWRTPIDRYRAWMNRAYHLEEKRAHRPGWITNINFAVQWAHADTNLLDALAQVHSPEKTLIHLSEWRTSKYDVDYPDYKPTQAAQEYCKKAQAMGFKVMPHFNYFACYNQHPFFQKVRDWQIRSVARNEPEGWYWPPDSHDYTRMAYIHPGLGLWRSTLIDVVSETCAALNTPVAFLDQTLCTWNTDNGLVENANTVQGLHRMQEEFAAVHPDLMLVGEGMNEISFQHHCFAQAHIHNGWGELKAHHIAATHPICSYLWQGHSRLVGYYHLNPEEKDVDIGIQVYHRMGAIPTLVCNKRDLISRDQPVVKKILSQISP